jgi:hypothetical protein
MQFWGFEHVGYISVYRYIQFVPVPKSECDIGSPLHRDELHMAKAKCHGEASERGILHLLVGVTLAGLVENKDEGRRDQRGDDQKQWALLKFATLIA